MHIKIKYSSNILNSIKKINTYENLITNEYIYTYQEIAAYYNATYEGVKSVLKRYGKEFDLYKEKIKINGDTLKKTKQFFHVEKHISVLTLFNVDGVLRIGLLMNDNVISERIKKLMLCNKGDIPDKYLNHFTKNIQPLLKQYTLYESIKQLLTGLYIVDKQVHCGKYRIDIVIDKVIAVECDEFNHQSYDKSKEQQREEFIKSKGYTLLRYNPDGKESTYEFINCILKEIHNKRLKDVG